MMHERWSTERDVPPSIIYKYNLRPDYTIIQAIKSGVKRLKVNDSRVAIRMRDIVYRSRNGLWLVVDTKRFKNGKKNKEMEEQAKRKDEEKR